MLAVVKSLKHFRFSVLGRRFIVRTDNSTLHWLRNFNEPAGQVARWLERLAEYDFEIVHRACKNPDNADELSRIPTTIATVTDEELWIAPDLKIEFCEEQRKDTIASTLHEWLSTAQRSDDNKMEDASRELRYYWARFDELLIQNGILGLLFYDENATSTFRAIVPKRLRQKLLELAHSSAGGGHFVYCTKDCQQTQVTFSLEPHDARRTRLVREMPVVQSP